MRRTLAALTGGKAGAMSRQAIDRDTAAKLAALGYVGGAVNAGGEETTSDKPDPKRMIDVFNTIRDANAALQKHRYAEAAATAQRAIDRDPSNAFASVVLANARFEQGRYADALSAYRTYAALVPASAEAHHRIAICYSRLGQ